MVVCALLFLETIFLNVLAPLLPSLRHELGLSTAQVGLLGAGYAIGALIGTLPGGLGVERYGPGACAIVGAVTLGVMSAAFGAAQSFGGLLAFRLMQGLGGALCWTAAMAWLMEGAPTHRRGELVGLGLAAAAAGSVLGPLLGSVAGIVGREVAFSGAGVVAILLGIPVWLSSAGLPRGKISEVRLSILRRSRSARAGAMLVAVTGLVISAIGVLGPLRLAEVGFGVRQIGALFAVAAGVGILFRPLMGRWTDRKGTTMPTRIGLLASGTVLLAIPWPTDRWWVAGLVLAGVISTGIYIPSTMLVLSDACISAGAGQIMAVVIVGLLWPPGSVLGSAGGGALAGLVGPRAAFGAMALAVFMSALLMERYYASG